MVGVNVIAADTDAEARRLFTSPQQAFANMFRGTRGKLQPPIDDIEVLLVADREDPGVEHAPVLRRRLPADRAGWAGPLIDQTGADELMVAAAIYDHGARLRSYEILAEAWHELN